MTSRLRTLLGCAALLLASAFGTAGVASAQSINITGCASLSAPVVQGSNINITCNQNIQPPGSPTCSGANMALVGTTLTFAATCTKGTNPITSITLSSGQTFCSAGTTPCGASPISVSIPGIAVPTVSTNYVVTASDGSLTGTASAFYSVSGGGGGAVDLSACGPLFPNAAVLDWSYPVPGNIPAHVDYVFSKAGGGAFVNSSALVIRFTTPALGVNDTVQPTFAAEIGSNGTRQATIGTAPCLVPTFNSTTLPVVKTMISQTPAFAITVVSGGVCPYIASGQPWLCSSSTWLAPNTTYYITLVNKGTFAGTANTCTVGNCDMRFDFNN